MALKGKDLTSLVPYKRARLGMARTFQNLRLIRQLSVLENVLLCFPSQAGEQLGNVFLQWKRCKQQESQNRDKAVALLEQAGLGEKVNDPAEALSYGQQKRVELGRAMAMKPKVLLMDEPVAGMNVEETEDMARFILDIKEERDLTIVLIEHDMSVIMDISDRVLAVNFGQKIAEGIPQEVQHHPDVVTAYLGEKKD